MTEEDRFLFYYLLTSLGSGLILWVFHAWEMIKQKTRFEQELKAARDYRRKLEFDLQETREELERCRNVRAEEDWKIRMDNLHQGTDSPETPAPST